MKTVIMAGGKGTRISELFPNIPKPLIRVSGKPILEWEIESLASQGFTEIILTVSYMHEKIEEYFGDGSRWGVTIKYFIEEQPLGNAGALYKLGLDDDFLLLNADSLFDVDFQRMVNFHLSHNALVTLFTHPNSHPYDSGLIIANEENAVEQWLTKEDIRPKYYKNRVNAGLHIINPKALTISGIHAEDVGIVGSDGHICKVDLDRNVLKPLCGRGEMYAYDSPEYVKDMGTPERYAEVAQDFASGIITAKNLINKQKAIFLDRDGTINVYKGFLRNIESFELMEGVTEAIKRINKSDYLCIVITNQPVIARGEVTVSELKEIHNKLETLLGEGGAFIDGLFYCPHHPHKGFEGEISELKIDCNCRKPKPGMLLSAAKKYNIDLYKSWMIGDGENDIIAGNAAGCKTIKLGDDDPRATTTAPNLYEAVRIILDNEMK